MFKKFLLSFLSVLILFQSTAAPVLAQANPARWYDQPINDWYSKVYDTKLSPSSEIFGERYTAAQVQWIIYSIYVFFINLFFTPDFTACIFSSNNFVAAIPGCIDNALWGWAKRVFDILKSAMGLGYDTAPDNTPKLTMLQKTFQPRPLSGISYTRQFFNKLNPVSDVHAQQGFGFNALSALQGIWNASRNIAYALLIFAAIILALMVMLRTKISPQTVITAQSAIPKLVFAAILITFSYAIAGFMVDLVYVVIGLISVLFTPLFGNGQPNQPQITSTIYTFLTIGPGGAGGSWGIFNMFIVYIILLVICFPIALFLGVGVALIALSPLLPFLPWILLGILAVVAIFVIILAFRIIIMLAKALVAVYLLVIGGPLYILGGVVYQGLSFGSWIRALLSNLFVFPVTGLMFLLAYIFMGYGSIAIVNNTILAAPIKALLNKIFGGDLIPTVGTGWSPPLLGAGGGPIGTGLIFITVSMAVLALAPKVADIIKSFMSGKPFSYGSAIGEFYGAALAPYNYAMGTGPGKELAQQASAQSAYGLVSGANKYVPASWRATAPTGPQGAAEPTHWWGKYVQRVGRRGGY